MTPTVLWVSDPAIDKPTRLARLAIALRWALDRLRSLAAPLCPSEAAALPAGKLKVKGKAMAVWSKPMFDLYDYALAARRFDALQTMTADELAVAQAAVTTTRLMRLGGLVELRDHADLATKSYQVREQDLRAVIAGIAGALERALELHALAGRGGGLDELLDALDRAWPPPA